MSGVYIHVPFCKQACHYCDFHFSTQMGTKPQVLEAIATEIRLRKEELSDQEVKTIYFGGGTPSVLSVDEINVLINTVRTHFEVDANAEITLEGNPDDLSKEKLKALSQSPINRLSIGVQSFFEADLKLMNRAHDAKEALACIQDAKSYFNNISIDLIYGIPNATDAQWKENIATALDLGVPHISSYALTVEPKTALKHFIEQGVVPPVDDEQAQRQFMILLETLESNGFMHYETSNFARPGFISKNNSAYWHGKPYIGIGPSAHSFDGKVRSWNVNNNIKYAKALEAGNIPSEKETLSLRDRYNEYVMTGLRTQWGVSLDRIQTEFGPLYRKYLEEQAEKYIQDHLLFKDGDSLLATKSGKFLVDGIASDLFMVNLVK
ncbi:MAG: radical SAM family heme chaperone HemW [Bacteroidota bacterium]